ncbi:Uncharacterised protein [Atlantibacter hermannii]|nr:Uncharacterised protein [Atlantibacter hermannii]
MFALAAGPFLCFVEWFGSLRAAGPLCVGWNGSVRFGQRGPFCVGWNGSVRFGLRGPFCVGWSYSVRFGLRGLFCRVESFRSLRAAVLINSHRRTRPGWGRSPPRPQHPRLPLPPSPLRGPLGLSASGFRVGRDTASCLSRPQAASLRACPGLPRTPRRGRWGPTPPRYFQVINGKTKYRYEYEKYSLRQMAFIKKNREVGALTHRDNNRSVKHKRFKVGGGSGIKIAERELTSQVRPAWTRA